jgi:S1-C subfamily serine protease
MPDTPADLAGIQEGDIIVSIDQQKIEAPADLVNYLKTRSAGEEVTLDILRKGDYLEIRVKLSETQLKKELDIRKI